MKQSNSTTSALLIPACLAPVSVFFACFWLLPVAKLITLPANADTGLATYLVVLSNPRYLMSLMQTVSLSLAVTAVTLILGGAVGIYLARHQFWGKRLLSSLLALPLSFPGVIIGFFMILMGGRQGLVADITDWAGWGRFTFAYGLLGLFLAYLYFSLPRAITTYTAAAAAMDRQLEEAARSLGASRFRVIRDVWLPELAPTTLACGAIIFATSMGAFGTAFTLATKFEVLPITIYNEFTNYANFTIAASLSMALGLMTWLVLFVARKLGSESSSKGVLSA